jgi:hypothetical protein
MTYKLELGKDQQIRVVVCSLSADLPASVPPFMEQLKTNASFHSHLCKELAEAVQLVPMDVGNAILIVCIQDKDEFVQVLQALTSLESTIQAGTLKVLAFSKMNHPRVISVLKSKGVSEIIDWNINAKAFGYKIKNAVQAIQQSIEKRKLAGADTSGAMGRGPARAGVNKAGSQFKVNWVPPIEHFSDFWILLQPKHARYVIGKWMVNFYGPGPSVGAWEETSLENNGEKGWKFNPRGGGEHPFYKDEGRWVFFGNCPEFSWEQRLWYFIAKKPSLYFYVGETIQHRKLDFSESGDLNVASNSEVGKGLKSAITNTIEASVLLHTDRDKNRGKVAFEDDTPESKELSAEIEHEEGTELNYRGAAEEHNELNGRFSEDVTKDLEATQEAFESSELQLRMTSKNGEAVSDHSPIKLIELRETQAIIDIPLGLLKAGDKIEFEANVQEGRKSKKLTFSASTKIVESELSDGSSGTETRAAAICELDQVIKLHFTDVVDQLQAKRELLNTFFKKAKGA